MFEQVINTIKDITGLRFYFLVMMLFFCFVLTTFKDQIKLIDFNPSNLQEVSNQKGLIQRLDLIKSETKLSNGYIFFLYQPKHDSYYKKLVTTDIPYVKENAYFMAMPLNAQKYLNYALIEKEYVLFEVSDPKAKDYVQTYGADYVFIYNVYVKETIGEVVFTFDVKPSEEQIQLLIKKLRNIKYFVI